MLSNRRKAVGNTGFSDGLGGASELVQTYCNKQIMDIYPLNVMEEFLDLLINSLEPQASNLIRNRVPAFRDAPEQAFSDSTGLEFYTASYVTYPMSSNMTNSMESIIGLNLPYFIAQNEEGEYVIASERKHLILNSSICDQSNFDTKDYVQCL